MRQEQEDVQLAMVLSLSEQETKQVKSVKVEMPFLTNSPLY